MASKDKKQSTRSKICVAYHLFIYKEELRHRKPHLLKLSKAKYQLTNDLVRKSWNSSTHYSKEDQDHLVDSLTYSKKLKKAIDESKSKKQKRRKEKKLTCV